MLKCTIPPTDWSWRKHQRFGKVAERTSSLTLIEERRHVALFDLNLGAAGQSGQMKKIFGIFRTFGSG
jgi:hypothetical protein